jgi:hypothetical protein
MNVENVKWSIEDMIEVRLKEDDDFLKVKELFALDGKPTNISENDLERRNTVVNLLHEWDLVEIVTPEKAQPTTSIRQMKILPFSEKSEWDLQAKYTIGNVGIRTTKEPKKENTFEIDDDFKV